MAEKETSKMLRDVQKMQFDSPLGKDLADIVRIRHVVGLSGDEIRAAVLGQSCTTALSWKRLIDQ